MTTNPYHSSLIQPSLKEAADTTSSQIVLSRGVASPDIPPESPDRRIMALGDAANSTPSLVDGADCRKSSTFSHTGGLRVDHQASVFSSASNISNAESSRQPSTPSAFSTLSTRTEPLNAARAAQQTIPNATRAPEDLRANARAARQFETEIRDGKVSSFFTLLVICR